jgi:hypothetical protein
MSLSVDGVELRGEAPFLLMWNVPNEVLNGFEVENFEETIGVSEAQFAAIAERLHPETANDLIRIQSDDVRPFRNALQAVIDELGEWEFQTRTGCDLSEGEKLRDDLDRFLREREEGSS